MADRSSESVRLARRPGTRRSRFSTVTGGIPSPIRTPAAGKPPSFCARSLACSCTDEAQNSPRRCVTGHRWAAVMHPENEPCTLEQLTRSGLRMPSRSKRCSARLWRVRTNSSISRRFPTGNRAGCSTLSPRRRQPTAISVGGSRSTTRCRGDGSGPSLGASNAWCHKRLQKPCVCDRQVDAAEKRIARSVIVRLQVSLRILARPRLRSPTRAEHMNHLHLLHTATGFRLSPTYRGGRRLRSVEPDVRAAGDHRLRPHLPRQAHRVARRRVDGLVLPVRPVRAGLSGRHRRRRLRAAQDLPAAADRHRHLQPPRSVAVHHLP